MLENDINNLRQERQVDRDRYISMSEKMDDMLTRFKEDSNDTMIDWETLSASIIGEIYHVNEKVCFIPVELTAAQLTFVTVVQDNGEFGLQEHDIDEYCKVLMGQLIEPLQDYKVSNVGDVQKYPAFTKHKPTGGNMLNIYWVTFKK